MNFTTDAIEFDVKFVLNVNHFGFHRFWHRELIPIPIPILYLCPVPNFPV